MQTYKQKYPQFETRVEESSKIREKYPDKVPIICEKASSSKLPDCERNRYLAPADLTAY